MSYEDHLGPILLAGCAALVAVVCANPAEALALESGTERRISNSREGGRDGPGEKRKKSWSGISYADQTYLQRLPLASFAASGFDSERVWGAGDDWEPAIAADPSAPYVYQMTTRYDTNPASIFFRRSVDGGATWEADQLFELNSGDPLVEVSDDGTVYTLGIVGNSWDLLLKRSFDHGLSWDDPPIDILGNGPNTWGDRPTLVVSPDGQHVYVAYNRGDIYVVASHDGGDTFEPEVRVTSNGRQWFTSAGAIAPNGDLYFAAADYSSGYTGPTYINVLRSTDDGVNWTVTLLDTSAESADCSSVDGCYFNFLGPEVGLAIDVNGLVMISYNAGDVNLQPHRLWVRTSADGVGWSGRTEISNAISGVSHGFPAMVASRTVPGVFHVVWQDDREGAMTAWNTWMVTTLDGGASWGEPLLLSDLDSGAPYKGPLGYDFVYGDYFEIAIDDQGTTYVIWGEGTSYIGPGGSWYTRGTPVPEPAAVYQLLAGVTLLAALLRRRSIVTPSG